MLSATILVKDDVGQLEKLFSFEEKKFQNDRAKYETKRTKNGLEFKIMAKDSVALRSVLNTITKIITVHEKTKEVLKNV